MKYKVAVARLPQLGWECQECVQWLIQTILQMKQDERISEVIWIIPGAQTPAPMLRNKIVVEAKKAGADYLISVDADQAPDLRLPGNKPFWPTAWEFLLKRRSWEEDAAFDEDHPVISKLYPPATIAAPYCGPSPRQHVYVFEWVNWASGKPEQDFRLEMISRESAAIRTGIQEVAALPTGLILYDMRVFDVLPPPHYRYEYTDETESEKATTEDVYQTRNASLLGLPQLVAWDCWAGHRKAEIVTKPALMTRDQVHASLREAVLRGVDRGDRLVFLPDDGNQERGDPCNIGPTEYLTDDDGRI